MTNKEYVIVQNNEQCSGMVDYLKKEQYTFSFDEKSLSIPNRKDLVFIIDPDTTQVSCEDADRVFEKAEIPVISTQRFFSEEFNKLLEEHGYSFNQEKQEIEDEVIQDPTPIAI